MTDRIPLVTNGEPQLAVYVPANAGLMERNAANMLAQEVLERSGTAVPVVEASDWQPECLRAIAIGANGTPPSSQDISTAIAGVTVTADEGFAIRIKGPVVVLAGKTGSGVIYAVDHVLDSLEYSGNDAALPAMDVDDQPDCHMRGSSFSTHGHAHYAEDREDMEGLKELVRFYARNRVNLMTIEATGNRWPGDLSPICTWKYFPPLQDESRNDKVRRRIDSINELIEYAHGYGVKVVLYTVEFNHDPDIYTRCPELHGVLPETWKEGLHNYIRGCICLSKDIAWDYWRAKVREAMEALPELDGLEVWTVEVPSEFGICACDDCRSRPRHEWLRKLYDETRETIDRIRPEMPLYIKTFQSSQGSLEVERFTPLKGKLPHNSTIVTKAQLGDMAYLNDPHPLLGWIQDGAEVTEFDVGGEYRGCGVGAMICCIPEYIAERMRLYYSKGLRRFLARHAIPTWPNHDLLDINETAFYKLAWHIDTDIEGIWHEWARERFGASSEKMVEALKLTDEVVNKSLYVRRACANRHYYIFCDNLDSLRYMMYDLSAQLIEGGPEMLEPTPENIRAITREKDEAIELCTQMIRKFEEVAPELPEELRTRLEKIFARTEQVVAVMRHTTEAAWLYFAYERCFSMRERDGMRAEILQVLKRCEEEIDKSQRRNVEQDFGGKSFWGIWKVVDFERARRLVQEIRANLNFRIGQSAEYGVTITPATVGHPNTYAMHRNRLREIFGLPGEG